MTKEELEKEIYELKQELREERRLKEIAEKRYNRVANELVEWYEKYGKEGLYDNKGSRNKTKVQTK